MTKDDKLIEALPFMVRCEDWEGYSRTREEAEASAKSLNEAGFCKHEHIIIDRRIS